MIRSFVLLICTVLICLNSLHAQPPCAFDKKHNDLLNSNPVFARQVEENNALIKRYIEAKRAKKPSDDPQVLATVTIPVVVHVMHTGGAIGSIYNPTDAQIMGAINYLNQVYNGSLPGMTPPFGGGAVVDMEIQFALAQRTPGCGATNGINRVDASSLPNYVARGVNADSTNGCPELTLKNFSRWNTADYYNIWIVNRIDSRDGTSGQFIAGFAYFPGASSSFDGTIMLATQMQAGEKTLPHEIGHALDLYHPFQGSANTSQCPTNTTCSTQGDRVCDTDPISNNYNAGTGVFSFACRAGANSCAGGAPYTINTESNFMSYTNCYTLFTDGQKLRTQAALTLPSRASLIDPGNLALVPCGTTINFTQTSATHTENSTGTTTGCRTYRDYNYQMTIGAGPTNAATATLSYGGTAIKGLDYEVTTNGNFSSQSDVLNFAAGSTTAQPFIVRIYDDGNVEPNETIVLDFTVNSGGGNATEGTTAPTLTLTLPDNDLNPVGGSSGTSSSIGTYTHNINSGSCFRSNKIKHKTQFLITKDELNTAGITNAASLTGVRFRIVTKNSTKAYSGFTVSLAHTADADLSAGFLAVPFTQVYSGNYTTAVGNNVITFSSPFAWDGESNIVVNLCFENATADAANDIMQGTLPASPTIYTVYADYISGPTAGCNLGAAFITDGRPNMSFDYAVTATAVETVAGSSSSDHMDAGSNDYFYSNNNRLLVNLTSISAPLGCVTTSVEEDGTNWVNYQGGERSAKVFAMTPTTNGSTASYTASFYFNNAELDGKNPASLRIAKTSAGSAAAANATNTILATPTVTTLGSGITIFTATFTGFSHFFLVDAAVTLPVTLTDFTVKLNADNDAVLNWTTASENNNNGFDVEMSRDGSNFIVLGNVASQGNSFVQQQYEYTHVKPQPGVTFYRLKQTDRDGKYEYSKIISLQVDNTITKATVYPVPAKNSITINFGTVISKAEIEIFSADMKTVKREVISGPLSTKDIAISNLSKGIYFIRYKRENSTEILRFIKE